jgi:tripartite-type tricarboxylate transporter receptor subunit TctC
MIRKAAALALLACTLSASARAESVESFYQGKQIRVIVGSGAGQDYDAWARFVARYMGAHIPGKPNFVVENMPGAGSLVAANYLFTKAAQDGTVIGSFSRNIPSYAFKKQPNVHFDPLRFNWIGSPEMTHRGCFARTDSGVKTAKDLFERELVVGTDGAGTALSETPVLLRNMLGMKFRTVDGYKGASDVVLAMQRNEVAGICQTVKAFGQGVGQQMLDSDTARLLFTTERERVPELKVPTIFEFTTTEEQRNILAFHASSLEMGRPLVAPPGIPAERVEALRRAFDATMKDPAFLAEARQRGLDIEPLTGEQITQVLRVIASFPEELLVKAGQLTRR